MDALGFGRNPLVGESAEGVGHQFEIGIEVAGAGRSGERRQPFGVPVRRHEGGRAGEGTGLGAPLRFPSEQAGSELPDHLGRKGGRQRGFHRPPVAVLDGGARRLDGGGAVSEVVGDHLMDVGGGAALAGQMSSGSVDDRPGQVDGARSPGQIWDGLRHGGEAT